MKKVICLVLAALLLAGCAGPVHPEMPEGTRPVYQGGSSQNDRPGEPPQGQQPGMMPGVPMLPQGQSVTVPEIAPVGLAVEDIFSDRDYDSEYDADACRISLNGSSAACQDAGVTVSGGCITITEKGTYILSGSLDAGMVIVDAGKKAKVQLVLENAKIHSETSAAIYIRQADKVFLTLAEGTENTLSNGGVFVPVDENNIDATVFSKDDLTVNGTGQLYIQSPAGHGIVSKDEATITGGRIHIDAAGHGITGQDCVAVDGAVLDILCKKDAIQAENEEDTAKGFVYIAGGTLNCKAQDNGIRTTGVLQIDGGTLNLQCTGDALHSETDIIVNGGSFAVATQDDGFHADNTLAIYGGSIAVTQSYEGLEAKQVLIAGGAITLVSQDDGINAAGGNDQSGFGGHKGGDRFQQGDDSCILISGGSLHVDASGDGIDSNGGLYVTGGNTLVEGPTNSGNGALDYGGTGALTGGVLMVTGPAEMAQSLYPQGQGVLFLSTGRQNGGTTIEISSAAGDILLSTTPNKAYSCLVASCPELVSGETYRVRIGADTTEIQAQ